VILLYNEMKTYLTFFKIYKLGKGTLSIVTK